MKFTDLIPRRDGKKGETVAVFGQARLVKRLDCNYELIGGTPGDVHDAKEWISLFMHEAVFQRSNPRG